MIELYISSIAFTGVTVEGMLDIVAKNGWALEFSSGIPFRDDMEALYLNSKIKRMPHNYFPAPEIPFVLNLASTDESIRQQSEQHCIRGLELAKKSNSPFFAAHAGFCIDPNPHELGKKINFKDDFDREINKEVFIASVRKVLKAADDLGIDFLIENNVIAEFNLTNKTNPLLCCDALEINWLFDTVKHNRLGLLLDTAHLKVSCMTLSKTIDHQFSEIQKNIKGIHHSDNDGKVDSNMPLTEQYWFLKYKDAFETLPQVLEVKGLTVEQIRKQINILNEIWN